MNLKLQFLIAIVLIVLSIIMGLNSLDQYKNRNSEQEFNKVVDKLDKIELKINHLLNKHGIGSGIGAIGEAPK